MGDGGGQIFQPPWIATRPPRIGSTLVDLKPASPIIASKCLHFREAADRFDQVAIAVLVLGDGLADARNDMLRIALVELAEAGPFAGREFEDSRSGRRASGRGALPEARPGCRSRSGCRRRSCRRRSWRRRSSASRHFRPARSGRRFRASRRAPCRPPSMSGLMSLTVTCAPLAAMRKAMSPVPPAMSRICSPGRGFTLATKRFFHSRCMPPDIRSFIRS